LPGDTNSTEPRLYGGAPAGGPHIRSATPPNAQRTISRTRRVQGPPADATNLGAVSPKALIISSKQFTEDFEPPDYLIDSLLQRRFLYSLTGPTGAGKTAIALRLSAHVALGQPLGDYAVEKGRVLYFAGENPDDLRMRWIAMSEHMDFDRSTIDVHFIVGAETAIAAVRDRIETEVKALGGVSLIVVDTSAAYFNCDECTDENDNVQAGKHARMFRSLTTLPEGPTVLVLAHPAKNAKNDNLLPRGGGAFIAEVDGNLVRRKEDALAELHWQGKFRGPDFEPVAFELPTVDAATLKDSKGRLIRTVLARISHTI
jgi:RecA-family ATPase